MDLLEKRKEEEKVNQKNTIEVPPIKMRRKSLIETKVNRATFKKISDIG